jgi:hypothetical protein
MAKQFFLPGFAPDPTTDASDTPELLLPGTRSSLQLPPLFRYPRVSGDMRSRHAKCLGRAGESLFDSLMFRLGLESFAPGENLGYDRIIALSSRARRPFQLASVQIKTVTAAEGGAYHFDMSCGYRKSPQGRRGYHDAAFDIAALVILPKNAVWFTAEKRAQHSIHISEVPRLLDDPQRSLMLALHQVLRTRVAAQEAAHAARAAKAASAEPTVH